MNAPHNALWIVHVLTLGGGAAARQTKLTHPTTGVEPMAQLAGLVTCAFLPFNLLRRPNINERAGAGGAWDACCMNVRHPCQAIAECWC